MTSAKSASLLDGVATQRARRRTLLERRKRFWRRIALFLVVTVVMVLVALANRDMLHRRDILEKAAIVASALQQAYDSHQQDPPLRIPDDLLARYETLRRDYYFNVLYVEQQRSRPQVGVCCLKKPVRFFLRSDGRMVILFEEKKFTAKWMTEGQFRDRASALGFDSTLVEK